MTALALTLGGTAGVGLVQVAAASAAAPAAVAVTLRVRLSGPDYTRNSVLAILNGPGMKSQYPCQQIPRDTWVDIPLSLPVGATVVAYASGFCYDGSGPRQFTVTGADQVLEADLVV